MPNLISFLALTVVVGGAASFMAGRALAATWRVPASLLLAAVPLAGATRFLHATLAGESTGWGQAVMAYALAVGFAGAGYGLRRRAQMARQYPWLAKV